MIGARLRCIQHSFDQVQSEQREPEPARQAAVVDAADVLSDLYLGRGERDQAIVGLQGLRLRATDRKLFMLWVNERVADIGAG